MTYLRATFIAAVCLVFGSCASPDSSSRSSSPSRQTTPAHTPKSLRSQTDFDSTVGRLTQAIADRKLTLFQVIDHGGGARSVGQPLGNSKLLLFGNPKVGTAFIQADPLFGLDLPLKALVYEKDGAVYVATTDIDALARQHGLEGLEPVRAKVRKTLADIAAEAAR